MGDGEKRQDFERGDDHVDWHYGEIEIWVYIYWGWWQMVINLKLDVGGFVDFCVRAGSESVLLKRKTWASHFSMTNGED
jgi:hypothetical protein